MRHFLRLVILLVILTYWLTLASPNSPVAVARLANTGKEWRTALLNLIPLITPTPTPTFGPTPTPGPTDTPDPTVTPTPVVYNTGALILVAGRLRETDQLQSNLHNVANHAYQIFRTYGYTDEQIYYLATDSGLAGFDAFATVDNLHAAITTWAVDKVGGNFNRPLIIYLVDHGSPDLIYLDEVNNQRLTPTDLDLWLAELESTVSNVESVVVIEAAYAGTFIEGSTSLNKAGRIIITSTDTSSNAYALMDGAIFSDKFLAQLGGYISLSTAFTAARQLVVTSYPAQQPWLNADYTPTPNQQGDIDIASRHALFGDTATPTLTPTGTNTPTHTPTPTPTFTPTPTLTWTPSATATATASATATATATASTTATATVTGNSTTDAFEADNSCGQAHSIAADGASQTHTFHVPADQDWVRFSATANVHYRIEVNVPAVSPADVDLELYPACDELPAPTQNPSFSPNIRLDFTPEQSGDIFLRLTNHDATVAGAQVTYEVNVRTFDQGLPNRALIIVAGRLKLGDNLQSNIHNITQSVYKVFQSNKYDNSQIQYLATNSALPGYTGAATTSNLKAAITTWAAQQLGDKGVLTLYMVDHGKPGLFLLDEVNGQRVTPADLNQWLTELEGKVGDLKINVIIEACESGSFITDASSISKAGRLIITSTDAANDAKASTNGAYFSDHFLTGLAQGYNLYASFFEARRVATQAYVFQDAWVEGDGDGHPNELEDAAVAAGRGFNYPGTFDDPWPPHIFRVDPPIAIANFTGEIRADVRDDVKVSQVWGVVYPPDYTPPSVSQQLQREVLPTFLLSDLGGNEFAGQYTGFTQPGRYRIVVQAEDNEGLKARPVVIEVNAGSRLFLPLVAQE
ncbi:MAG: C13 family peptidase [Caldilineaceae bacterium]